MDIEQSIIKSGYTVQLLQDIIHVNGIVTIHYFEYSRDFVFEGEEHDFWELVYVDKGEVEVTAGEKGYRLCQGDIIFHQPGEFHSIWADGHIAPNIIVIAFDARSEGMTAFQELILKVEPTCRNLISRILTEGIMVYEGPFDDPYLKRMMKREDAAVDCEQMLRTYLELLLLNIYREKGKEKSSYRSLNTITERTYESIADKVDKYLIKNMNRNITLEEISFEFHISKSYLSKIFRHMTGDTVIHRSIYLKIEEARKLIREGNYTITQIADMLGYQSISYFSNHFKQWTNLSPRMYAQSVKAKVDSGI